MSSRNNDCKRWLSLHDLLLNSHRLLIQKLSVSFLNLSLYLFISLWFLNVWWNYRWILYLWSHLTKLKAIGFCLLPVKNFSRKHLLLYIYLPWRPHGIIWSAFIERKETTWHQKEKDDSKWPTIYLEIVGPALNHFRGTVSDITNLVAGNFIISH